MGHPIDDNRVKLKTVFFCKYILRIERCFHIKEKQGAYWHNDNHWNKSIYNTHEQRGMKPVMLHAIQTQTGKRHKKQQRSQQAIRSPVSSGKEQDATQDKPLNGAQQNNGLQQPGNE